MAKAFKANPKIESAWDKWADGVLGQGKVAKVFSMYESGHYDWCIELDNGIQRFCRNMPEHIQRRIGVPDDQIIEDICLDGRTYWCKKAKAEGDA